MSEFTTWIIGGLLALVKGLLLYVWFNQDSKLTKVSDSHAELKERLMSNYYDKVETEKYVATELRTVQQSIEHLASVIVPLTDELRKLNDKVLVLETKEQMNGGVRGSSQTL